MTAPDETAAGAGIPGSPGVLLRTAREARGLTVDEVAGRLRLRPHLVEALERDDLAALGTGPYGRGQLRNYARLVGVEEARVLPPAPPAHPGQRHAPTVPRSGLRRPSLVSRPRPRWPLRALSGAVFGIVGVLAIVWALGTGREPAPATDVTAPLPAAPPPPRATPPYPGRASATPPAPGYQVAPVPLPPAPPPLPGGTPAGGASAPVTPAPGPPAGSAELALRFSGPCWIEVKDAAGARLLYRMARAGDRHVIRGSPPFAVMLGNAREVEITYNGAPFPKPNTARPVVRLTVGG